MISLNYLIVEVESEYENERDGIVSNVDHSNTFFITREATVVAAPDFVKVEKGDKVLCHHNIFRKKGDVSGIIIHSAFHIEKKLYYVPLTEVFMYKRTGEWQALSPFCFIEPIKENYNQSGLHLSEIEAMVETHKGYKKNRGIIRFPCEELKDKEGHEVIFSDYSEYEFYIDGKIYYKMSLKDILGFIDERIK